MNIVCREMYRAAAVEWSPEAEEKVAFYEEAGYGKVRTGCPCCLLRYWVCEGLFCVLQDQRLLASAPSPAQLNRRSRGTST